MTCNASSCTYWQSICLSIFKWVSETRRRSQVCSDLMDLADRLNGSITNSKSVGSVRTWLSPRVSDTLFKLYFNGILLHSWVSIHIHTNLIWWVPSIEKWAVKWFCIYLRVSVSDIKLQRLSFHIPHRQTNLVFYWKNMKLLSEWSDLIQLWSSIFIDCETGRHKIWQHPIVCPSVCPFMRLSICLCSPSSTTFHISPLIRDTETNWRVHTDRWTNGQTLPCALSPVWQSQICELSFNLCLHVEIYARRMGFDIWAIIINFKSMTIYSQLIFRFHLTCKPADRKLQKSGQVLLSHNINFNGTYSKTIKLRIVDNLRIHYVTHGR